MSMKFSQEDEVSQRRTPLGTNVNPGGIDWGHPVNSQTVFKTAPPYIGVGNPHLGANNN